MSLTVSALYCYPVKSMGEIALSEATIDRFGVLNDRRWMLVDQQGKFVTQRQCAEMVHFKVALSCDELMITDVRDGSSLNVGFAAFSGEQIMTVTVWRDQCLAWVANQDVNQWLADRLGRACRLVYMPESTQRYVDKGYAKQQETVSFADGFPLLLTTEASLDAINQHLDQSIEMLRFRPNLVISGSSPWAEDQWQRIRIGELEFDLVKPCSRCAIPTINRQTAQKEPQVFRVLKTHRTQEGEVYFGQNLLPQGQGVIQVGDRVELLA